MADVRPFRALRYDSRAAPDWATLLGPPYDVIDAEERADLLARSPYQITHIESPAGADGVAAAAARLRQWRREGVLRRDGAPAFYVEEHRFRHGGRERARTCLYAAVRLVPWHEGGVAPHEETMSGPKEERLRLREAVGADVSPLLALVADRRGRVGEALEAALAVAKAVEAAAEGMDGSGERHTLRILDDPGSVRALESALGGETLYIADGHHRYESALAHRDRCAAAAGAEWNHDAAANFVLIGIVRADDPGLIVGATHRLVQVEPPPDVVARIGDLFQIRSVGAAGEGAEPLLRALDGTAGGETAIAAVGLDREHVQLLVADERTRAAMPRGLPASWAGVGTALLQTLILEPLFGIDEAALRAGAAVTYSHDAAATYEAVVEGRARVAFLLRPPALSHVFAAADAGERMPQKSTFFTPKLPTGLVLHPFD